MNEVIERLREIASGLPAKDFLDLSRLVPPVLRPARAPWCSSLSATDLQCLLQVIEAELIPQLVRGYSPARCSPQELSPE